MYSFTTVKNRDRAIPHSIGFYPVSKPMGKHDRDLTNEKIDKQKIDKIVMEDRACISQIFEYLKKRKGELNG